MGNLAKGSPLIKKLIFFVSYLTRADINSDIKLRAFIESLRSRIAWNYRLVDPKYEISFSFGVACYPENGMDMRIVHRKLVKALQMAQEKHANCYVIYKEHLHGELS